MDISLLTWNLAAAPLLTTVAAEPVDVALLQEVARPAGDLPVTLIPDPAEDPWRTDGWKSRPWRTAIAKVSDRVELREIPTDQLCDQDRSRLAVSRPGTLTAADVLLGNDAIITVVSWYASWEHPPGDTRLLGADSAAHRLLSDLAALVDHDRHHRHLIVAGDLNLLYGYGEHGNPYWARRYATVFERAEAMGLTMVGPQHPHGRQAEPWPAELPTGSRNVPTYHTARQRPASATRQLDFVFASHAIADRVRVQALNSINEWGPSDHCRIRIELANP